MSSAATATADAVAPKVLVGALSQFTTARSLTFRWSGIDAGAVNFFDVKYVYGNAYGGWGGVRSMSHEGATSFVLPTIPGLEYCFKVRATDMAGNVSAWSPAVCSTVLADDHALAASASWAHLSSRSAYRGTLASTRTVGATLKATVSGNKIGVLGTACAKCGVIGVYMGSALVGKIRTGSATTHYGILWTTPAFVSRKAVVTFKVLSGMVQVDGFGISRTPPSF